MGATHRKPTENCLINSTQPVRPLSARCSVKALQAEFVPGSMRADRLAEEVAFRFRGLERSTSGFARRLRRFEDESLRVGVRVHAVVRSLPARQPADFLWRCRPGQLQSPAWIPSTLWSGAVASTAGDSLCFRLFLPRGSWANLAANSLLSARPGGVRALPASRSRSSKSVMVRRSTPRTAVARLATSTIRASRTRSCGATEDASSSTRCGPWVSARS